MENVNDQTNITVIEIRVLVSFLAKAMRSDLDRRLTAKNSGIGYLQFFTLCLLDRQEYTITELSRKLGLESATLVPVIDILERHGFVKRGHDPKDRRRNPLIITEDARTLLLQLPLVDPADSLMQGVEKIGQEKTQQFLSLLRELVEAIVDDKNALEELLFIVRLQKPAR